MVRRVNINGPNTPNPAVLAANASINMLMNAMDTFVPNAFSVYNCSNFFASSIAFGVVINWACWVVK